MGRRASCPPSAEIVVPHAPTELLPADGAAPPRHQCLPPRPRGALRRRPQARPVPRRDARALRRVGARLPRGGARPRRPARADPPRGGSRGPAARGREQPQGLDPRDDAPRPGARRGARAPMERLPLLPVEEEGRLRDGALRARFIERVLAYARWKGAVAAGVTRRRLATFHAAHERLLRAHDPTACRRLGALVANAGKRPPRAVVAAYGAGFMEALHTAPPSTRRRAPAPPAARRSPRGRPAASRRAPRRPRSSP